MAGLFAFATVVGCVYVPDDVVDPARAAGVRVALQVHGAAVDRARTIAARPRPSCRQPLPSGPLTVDTTIAWHQKGPGLPVQRIVQTQRFMRDAEGSTSLTTTVAFQLPDGRPTERTMATRIVDGARYEAVDGRFADATRLGLDRDLLADSFSDVDGLLSTLTVADGEVVPAAGGGLCNGHFPTVFPAIDAGQIVFDLRGRSGWLRWADTTHRMRLVVDFRERIRFAADPVLVPETIWPIDPDRSWRQVTAFIDEGAEAGWLRLPADDAHQP